MKKISKRMIVAGMVLLCAVAGAVAVLGHNRSVAANIRACDSVDVAKKQMCLKKVVQQAVSWYGIDAALDGVGEVFAQDGSAGQLCHDLTHIIGQEAYRVYARGEDVPITPNTTYCSYGFFHGVSEALLAATGDIRDVRKFCEYIVAQSALRGPDPEYQCYHGLGHGTVNPHDPALWGDALAMTKPAMDLCRQVAQTAAQLESCGTGIFAGIASFFSQGTYGLTVDREDPFWLCRAMPEDFREPCFRDMSSVSIVAADGDWRGAASYIEAIPEDLYAQSAMRSLGIDAQTVEASICRSLQPRLQHSCIQDFVRQTWQDSKPGQEFDTMFEFCSSGEVLQTEQDTCFRYAFGYLRMYASTEGERVCGRVADEAFRPVCKEYISYEEEI